MHAIIDTLGALVTQGDVLTTEAEPELVGLQDWVAQRGSLLQSLHRLEGEWSAADRQAIRSLFERLLALDAVLVARLEARLQNLGSEILSARKISRALGNNSPASSARLIARAV